MRPIAKPFLTATVIVACLLLAVTLLPNVWLRLPSTRERLLSLARQACGTDVSFGSLYALPWGDIRITGITSQAKDSPVRFTADAVRIGISPGALLCGKISVTSCSLERPLLDLPVSSTAMSAGQGVGGAAPDSSGHGGGTTLAVPSPTLQPSAAIPSGQSKSTPTPILSPEGSLAVRNGEFRLMDASSKPIVLFTGVNLVGGQLTADKVIVGNTLIFRDLRGTLVGQGDTLALRDFRALIGGGIISGTLDTRDVFAHQPHYRLGIDLQGADLNRLMSDAAYPSTSAKGAVSGTLSLEGVAGQGSTMHGEGTLLLKEASLQPVDFLRQIGRILSIEELQLLRISEGKCLFRIESGKFRMEDLLLRSDNLMLAARGPVNANGELDLQTRILFNAKLTSRLKGILGSQLTPAPETGYTQVAFHVTGPALNPRTDLLERLTGIRIGGDLGGLGNLLQGLFGKPVPAQPGH